MLTVLDTFDHRKRLYVVRIYDVMPSLMGWFASAPPSRIFP
jgi:hypothetical protein